MHKGRGRSGGFRSSGGGIRSSTNALLQRANAQLKGERVPLSKDEDEDDGLGDYLSGLNRTGKKDVQEVDWSKLADISDPSVSGDEAPANAIPANKFIKKKRTENASNKENNTKSAYSKFSGKPVSSTGTPHKSRNYMQKSSALSKAAAYTSKYASKEKREILQLSESDLDMDLSMDEDVMAEIQSVNSKKQPTANRHDKDTFQTSSSRQKNMKSDPQHAQPFKHSASPRLSSDSELGHGGKQFLKKKSVGQRRFEDSPISLDEISSQSEVGKGGAKFLKKKQPAMQDVSSSQPMKVSSASRKSQFRLASSERYSTKVELDTDEESMAQYIDGLSQSSSADQHPHTQQPKSSQSPRLRRKSPVVQSLESMEEVREEEEDETLHTSNSEADSVSSAGSFKQVGKKDHLSGDEDQISELTPAVNLMDLDSLEPVLTVETPRYNSNDSKSKESKPAKSSSHKERTEATRAKKETKGSTSKGKKDQVKAGLDLFSTLGLQTVDDLLANSGDEFQSDVEELDIKTEFDDIKTEADNQYESDFDIPSVTTNRSPTPPLKSILSQTPREKTPRSARGRVRLSLGDIVQVRSRSRSPSPEVISTARGSVSYIYTEEFESEPETAVSVKTEAESETDSVSEYTSGSPPYSGRSSPLRRRRLSGPSVTDDYYSDDFTITEVTTHRGHQYTRSSSRESMASSFTDDYTSYTETSDSRSKSRTPSPEQHLRRSSKMRNAEVQTTQEPGLAYHWNLQTGGQAIVGSQYGLGFVDPTPIATHVVGADALEAMTAYSPSVLALNDMLRQQLQLTQNFVHMTRHLHQSYAGTMEPTHSYTTLEDTKKYIKKNRKPRLTFEEALKQVKAEMELNS